MSYQQALKDLTKNLRSTETKHNVSPREEENNEIISISQQESARAQKSQLTQLTLSERLRLGDMPSQCLEHPEEDLQFYCFNNNRVVCAECLVKGAYAGMEISNLKKASEKLKGKFNELIQDVNIKHEACTSLKEELEAHEAKLEEDFAGYEQEVRKEMENFREAINKKEQELLGKIAAAKEEKLETVRGSTNSVKEFQEEMEEIKDTIKGNIMELNETNICHYYSKTASFITDHLNGTVNSEIEKTKRNLKFLSLQNHVQLSSFHEDCQKLQDQISNISTQLNKNKSFTANFLLEKADIFGKDCLALSKVSTPVQKETKDGDVSERKRISREAFISQCLNQLDSTTSSQVPGFTLKTTPGEQQISPKSSARQPSARSPLLTEMGKYDSNRNDYMKNFLQKYGNTNNHRSQESLSPRVDLHEFMKKPKASAREDTRTESSILSSKLSPRQLLQESSLLSRSPKIASSRKWPLETGADQFNTFRTNSKDKTFSYLNKGVKKGDIGLDLKKILSGTKTTQKLGVEKCVLRESKLKERLEQLSSRLFN